MLLLKFEIGVSLELGNWNLEFCAPILCQEKQLSFGRRPLSSAFHAEIHRPQQDPKGRSQTIQDHGARQGIARSIVPASSSFREERQAKTTVKQDGPRGQDRRGAGKSKSAVRLNWFATR